MEIVINQFLIFLLVLIRIASFFVVVPIFSYRAIPNRVKIGLAFFLAIPASFSAGGIAINSLGFFIPLVIKEILVGLAIGLIVHILFSAIQVAGGFIDFQMGFALANVIDPQTGAQVPIMGQYLYMFSILFLLATDGHHLLLDGIFYSYQFIPLDQLALGFGEAGTIEMVAKVFLAMFAIAFQISIPIVGSIFLIDIALGILARTVPQLNIFVVGFPVKILSGFILLIVVIGSMVYSVKNLFELLLFAMRDLMKLLGQ